MTYRLAAITKTTTYNINGFTSISFNESYRECLAYMAKNPEVLSVLVFSDIGSTTVIKKKHINKYKRNIT